jgi:predicted short-subunit dehydrogenase-like oxidoreductase (DUF2520 family)
MSTPIRNIVLIGSGNIAAYFGTVFMNSACRILQVISRNSLTGKALAHTLGAEYSHQYHINEAAQLVLIAVNDDAIPDVAEAIGKSNALVCHCAGAVDLSALDRFEHRGVIYPLQSMKGHLPASEVPLLLEAGSEQLLSEMEHLLHACGFTCHRTPSALRLYYHLAAVFANNFSNAMLSASEDIGNAYGLDADVLKPLVRHTFERALLNTANEATKPLCKSTWTC